MPRLFLFVVCVMSVYGCGIVTPEHRDEVLIGQEAGAPDASGDMTVPDEGTPDASLFKPALGSDECGAAVPDAMQLFGNEDIEFSTEGRTNKVSSACTLAGLGGADTFFRIEVEMAGEQWHFHLQSQSASNPVVYVLSEQGAGCNERSACIGGSDGNQCDGGGDEHFAVTFPAAGNYFLGIDNFDPGPQAYALFASKLTKQCNGESQSHGEGCDVDRTGQPDGALIPIGQTGNFCDPDCRVNLRSASANGVLDTVEPTSTLPEANVIDLIGEDDQTVTVQGFVGGGGCKRRPALYRVIVPDGKMLRVTPLVGDMLCSAATAPSFLSTALLLPGGSSAGVSGSAPCNDFLADVAQGTYVIQILPPPSGDLTDFRFEAALE